MTVKIKNLFGRKRVQVQVQVQAQVQLFFGFCVEDNLEKIQKIQIIGLVSTLVLEGV